MSAESATIKIIRKSNQLLRAPHRVWGVRRRSRFAPLGRDWNFISINLLKNESPSDFSNGDSFALFSFQLLCCLPWRGRQHKLKLFLMFMEVLSYHLLCCILWIALSEREWRLRLKIAAEIAFSSSTTAMGIRDNRITTNHWLPFRTAVLKITESG